jgi:hypothetical protein
MSKLDRLIIEDSKKTPQIDLNHITGDLIFSGKSVPENAAKVYEPALNWITEYIRYPRPTTNLKLDLEYFNTASLLWLTKILKALIQINEPDYVLIINLFMDVDDFDDIEDFEDIKDAFIPISNVINNTIPCIGIKLYAKNEAGEIVKEALVFVESEQLVL